LNGFKYTITNSIYDQTPNNPLAPGDAGGPSATSASTTVAAPPAGATVVTETVDGNAIPVTVSWLFRRHDRTWKLSCKVCSNNTFGVLYTSKRHNYHDDDN
jgi:hypothetical protein